MLLGHSTARLCGGGKEDDESLFYHSLEEFDTGVVWFFHHDSLQRLIDHGLIDVNIRDQSLRLRAKAIQLMERKKELHEIRHDPEWTEVFQIFDEITKLKRSFDE